ncbi:MAG TPA: hypothetical protein VFZ35_03835 [Sphingomicrobium sp.]
MPNDSDSFRRRAAALHGDEGVDAEVAGHLALAYAAIERHRRAVGEASEVETAGPDEQPILLQE